MTDNNKKKKKVSWFKAFNPNQSQLEEDNVTQSVDRAKAIEKKQLDHMEDPNIKDMENDNVLLLKDNQDKIVTDLIVSLENMIKDRQLILYKNNDIDEQLFVANETISRIKQDLKNKEQLLLKKNREMEGLESNLTDRQMTYDQLLEDYKDYQNTSNTEYEKISIQLDTEINKYNRLNDELIASQHQNMLAINELEEKNRNLEIENKQYKQQYEKVVDEKSELMKTINDFTDRMSFSLSSKPSNNSSDSK